MINFNNVTKYYATNGGGKKTILENASFQIHKGQSPALIGLNGAGKSTLIRMISGNELPDSGKITRKNINISWPLGLANFQGSLTGRENVRFVARLYGIEPKEIIDYVVDFAEIGDYFDMPIKTYSSGMRSRLAFGLSMAIEFDFYLIDEIISVGDARFKAKCAQAFMTKSHKSNMIMVSHSEKTLNDFCNCAFWLREGSIYYFENVKTALAEYNNYTKGLSIQLK